MPTPNFCAWEAVRVQVANNLHVLPADLPAAWDNICSHSARRAAAELRSILILKGYTPAQVALWSDGYTYSLQLATYFALTSGSALCNYDGKLIEWMDCRKEMREAQAIIIGEDAVAPAGEVLGGLASGDVAAVATAGDRFDCLSNRRWPDCC